MRSLAGTAFDDYDIGDGRRDGSVQREGSEGGQMASNEYIVVFNL